MQNLEESEDEANADLPIPGFKLQTWLGHTSLDHLRLALLGLTALATLILGWSLIEQALHVDPTTAAKTAAGTASPAAPAPTDAEVAARTEMRQKIQAQLAQSPEYTRFFDRLKLVYPTEYESIMDTFAKRASTAGETDGIDAMMSEAVRALRLSHGVLAAKASDAAVQKIFTIQLAMMQALGAKDQRLCVDFLYGGVSRGFFQFSAENRSLVADMAISGLDAMSDGQTSKIERLAPAATDFQTLEKALRDRGLSTPEIESLLDGKTADPPITDARMCTVGQIYLQTLANLPETIRYRLYALAIELMARS